MGHDRRGLPCRSAALCGARPGGSAQLRTWAQPAADALISASRCLDMHTVMPRSASRRTGVRISMRRAGCILCAGVRSPQASTHGMVVVLRLPGDPVPQEAGAAEDDGGEDREEDARGAEALLRHARAPRMRLGAAGCARSSTATRGRRREHGGHVRPRSPLGHRCDGHTRPGRPHRVLVSEGRHRPCGSPPEASSGQRRSEHGALAVQFVVAGFSPLPEAAGPPLFGAEG
jgi:hypothetical protein